MQPFQSLQRLLIFYALTLLVMLSLYYFALFHNMKAHNEQQSIDTFHVLQHEITEHVEPLNSEISKILEKPVFDGVSYQLVLMMPSGQTYIHRHTRPNEVAFSTITFPKVISSPNSDSSSYSAYTLKAHNLAGAIEFRSGHKLHVILRHKPLDIDWVSYQYWLPLMTAIMFFIAALLYMLNRRTNWEQLLVYTDNLSSQAKEAYTPPPFMESKSTTEFLRLGHALSRISYQLHNNHRRIKTLKHRLERLVNQAPLPMLMIMRHGQISFFNQRFEQAFTLSSQSHDTYELTDFFVGKDEPTQLLLSTLSNLRVTRTVTVLGLKNQQTYQLHITPWFGEHGQVHGFTVLLNNIHDLTEHAEHVQQQNQQLQQKLDEFNELKFIMGRQLRMPLEAMIDTLEPINPSRLSTKQTETLNVLIKTSQSMLTTLNDTLGIEETEARKTRLNIQPVDIYKLGQEVNDLIIDKTRQQGLELIYTFSPNCPRCIDTDDVRLRQILLNLLHNAIDFTVSGYVALTVEAISEAHLPHTSADGLYTLDRHVAKEQSHHWVRFSVQDTGVGIPAIKQSQLLNDFDQPHSQQTKSKDDSVGTGLGLKNVSSFAQLLGGVIQLKSTVDKGSTFELYLPCLHPNYQSVYHRNQHLTQIHLLAIIDQPLVAEHLQLLCKHLSITATIHTSIDLTTLHQSIEQMTQGTPVSAPILLLDYEYYDASSIIVDDMPLPKILCSMKPERRIPSMLLDKCDGFLTKPLDSALLIAELTRLTLPARQVLTKSQAVKVADPSKPLAQDISAATVSPLILVVEDSPTNQKIACKILSKLGYRSVVAEDGAQALEVLKAQRQDISLILMDCRMPVMDGLQATQAIRALGDEIPIVALTANNTQEDREACTQVGMDDFLSKPINKKQLDTVLQRFLAS